MKRRSFIGAALLAFLIPKRLLANDYTKISLFDYDWALVGSAEKIIFNNTRFRHTWTIIGTGDVSPAIFKVDPNAKFKPEHVKQLRRVITKISGFIHNAKFDDKAKLMSSFTNLFHYKAQCRPFHAVIESGGNKTIIKNVWLFSDVNSDTIEFEAGSIERC